MSIKKFIAGALLYGGTLALAGGTALAGGGGHGHDDCTTTSTTTTTTSVAPTTTAAAPTTTAPTTTTTTVAPTTSTAAPTTEPTTTSTTVAPTTTAAPTTAPPMPTIFVDFDCRGFTLSNENDVELSVNIEFSNEPNKLVSVPAHGSVNVPLAVDVHALVRPVGDVAVFGKAEATGLDCQVTPPSTVVEQEPPTLPPTASPSLPATGRDPFPIALVASVTTALGVLLLTVRRRKVTKGEGIRW